MHPNAPRGYGPGCDNITNTLGQGCGVGAQAILEAWSWCNTFRWGSQSLKFGFQYQRRRLWVKRVVQIIQLFLVFNGPNRSGAGSGAKNLNAWSWSLESDLSSGFTTLRWPGTSPRQTLRSLQSRYQGHSQK